MRGPGITEFGLNLPDESAAAAVTSLKVDPGGLRETIGRFNKGLSGSLSSLL